MYNILRLAIINLQKKIHRGVIWGISMATAKNRCLMYKEINSTLSSTRISRNVHLSKFLMPNINDEKRIFEERLEDIQHIKFHLNCNDPPESFSRKSVKSSQSATIDIDAYSDARMGEDPPETEVKFVNSTNSTVPAIDSETKKKSKSIEGMKSSQDNVCITPVSEAEKESKPIEQKNSSQDNVSKATADETLKKSNSTNETKSSLDNICIAAACEAKKVSKPIEPKKSALDNVCKAHKDVTLQKSKAIEEKKNPLESVCIAPVVEAKEVSKPSEHKKSVLDNAFKAPIDESLKNSKSVANNKSVLYNACVAPVDIIDSWEDAVVAKQGTVDIDAYEDDSEDELPAIPKDRNNVYEFKGIKVTLPKRMLREETYRYSLDPEDKYRPDDIRVCTYKK